MMAYNNTDNTNNINNINNIYIMATKDKKNFADSMAIRVPDGLDGVFPATPSGDATAAQAPQAPKVDRRLKATDTKDGRQQITFKLPAEIIEKLRAMAYWERREQWQIVAEWLQLGIDSYEDEHGVLEPVPKK